MPSATIRLSPRRRKGGQPGNTNAIKHGFYARQFSPGEDADLDAISPDLAGEINAMRVAIRRVLELADQDQEKPTYARAMSTLGALGQASTSLANLLRTQRLLTDQQTDISAAISAALADVVAELGVTA